MAAHSYQIGTKHDEKGGQNYTWKRTFQLDDKNIVHLSFLTLVCMLELQLIKSSYRIN